MKRFVCFLLALVMIAGMLPMTAPIARAAEWSTSSKAIDKILTKPDRFVKNAYDGGYIGYGTKVAADKAAAQNKYPNGISEGDAKKLLKDYLEDTVDPAINAALPGLILTQEQHDALAVFCMEMKDTSWLNTSGHSLREAIRTYKTGNAFLNAIAQVGISNPANDETLQVKMNLRMSIANLYLNGDYAYICPSNYTYVVLDYKTGDNKLIAYDSSIGYTLAEIDNTATSFVGWFKSSDIENGKIKGQAITKLNKDTAKLTLISGFESNSTEYTINSSKLGMSYFFADPVAKADYGTKMTAEALKKLDVVKSNSSLTVIGERIVDDIKWLKVNGENSNGKKLYNKWVYLGEIPEADKPAAETVVATATMTSNADIMEGAASNSAKTGKSIPKGTTVNIYGFQVEQTQTKGNITWAKVNYESTIGWINTQKADVKELSGTNNSADGRTGTIVNAEEVNFRSEAGVKPNTILGQLKKGTKVKVLETKVEGDAQWGLLEWDTLINGYKQGWAYMYYVNLDGLSQSQPNGGGSTGLGDILYTGVVTSNINLNVRKSADIYAGLTGKTLPKGTKVNIYELKTSRNMKWAKIGEKQWVCTAYLQMTKVENPAGSGSGTTSTTSLQGTVTVSSLNFFKNYNSNSTVMGTLKKGDVVTILEQQSIATGSGTQIWGKIIKDGVEGWLNQAYVELKTVTSVNGGSTGGTSTGGTNAGGAAGMVANCVTLNIRSEAGVYNTRIAGLTNGTAVQVYDRITKDEAPWVRITWNNGQNEGWACANYIIMSTGGGSLNTNGSTVNGTNSNTISATGIVNSNINLRVRTGAGIEYAEMGSLAKGTRVTIYEQVNNNGAIWGRIYYNNAPAYICLTYVTVDNASYTGKGVMGTIARCAVAVNVRTAPGATNAKVGTIGVGQRVEVFETKYHGTALWCRVAQGWISGDYVLMDSQLAPGTSLDAPAPTEAPTQPSVPQETVNRDNEVAYTINGTVSNGGKALKVYNDASEKSDQIGTVNDGLSLNILAVKNNGADLFGRIDQYDTAGWVNMANVAYSVTGYINTDEQPVYKSADTNSTSMGKLTINTAVTINKLTVNGDTVYGWYQDSTVSGWVPMGRVSDKKVDVTPTYNATEKVIGIVNGVDADVVGRTNSTISAYSGVGNGDEIFFVSSGTTTYIGEIRLYNGVVWGKIKVKDVDGNDVIGWINLHTVSFQMYCAVGVDNLKVWKTKDTSDEANLLGTMALNGAVYISDLSFDGSGNLWGQVTGHGDAALNGGYVPMSNVNASIFIGVK